jgi:hypothetical protein
MGTTRHFHVVFDVRVPGAALQGGDTPTRQQIGKLLSQSAKLYWLKITTEETKIDFLNN